MSSGYPGGDFTSHAGIRGGRPATNNFSAGVQHRPHLGGYLLDPSSSYPLLLSRQQPAPCKRSLSDLESMQQQNFFLRSVKQKTHLTSPISPLSPVDLSSSASPEISTTTSSSGKVGASLLQQPQQSNSLGSFDFSFASASDLQLVPGGMPDKEKSMKSRLQELERQLLDDVIDDEGDGAEGSDVSALTTSGWSETMKNLISPKPIPTSPSSSSSSCATTAASTTPLPQTSSSPPAPCCPKQLLFDSAAAIAERKTEEAASILARLKQVSSPHGGDTEQRLAWYMASALLSRINLPESGGGQAVAELFSGEQLVATQMLYDASPCFKLAFMAANLSILEAAREHSKIHIVDFDIGRGMQYISLIQLLATHPTIKTIRISAVTDPAAGIGGLQLVGDWLTKLAERLRVCLRFDVVRRGASDLSRETLGCDQDEPLFVNFAFLLHRVADESVSTANPRDGLLRAAKGLRPVAVTLVEQQMNANTASFLTRFGEVWAYHRALFESLESTMARSASHRVRIEECLARKASNSVAREGVERVERCEVLGKWRARMTMAGFRPRPLPAGVAQPLQDRAQKTHRAFSVKEESGGIYFSWMGRDLTVASAWC